MAAQGYGAVDTIVQGTRTAGDIQGKVIMGLIKQATTRVNLIGSTDPKEASICRTVLDGSYPQSWTRIVLGILDIQGNLTAPTDVQIDAAVVAAWVYFLAARQIG